MTSLERVRDAHPLLGLTFRQEGLYEGMINPEKAPEHDLEEGHSEKKNEFGPFDPRTPRTNDEKGLFTDASSGEDDEREYLEDMQKKTLHPLLSPTEDFGEAKENTHTIPFSQIRSTLNLTPRKEEGVFTRLGNWVQSLVFEPPCTLSRIDKNVLEILVLYKNLIDRVSEDIYLNRELLIQVSKEITTAIRAIKPHSPLGLERKTEESAGKKSVSKARSSFAAKKNLDKERETRREFLKPYYQLKEDWIVISSHNLPTLEAQLQNTQLIQKSTILDDLMNAARAVDKFFLESNPMIPGLAPFKVNRLVTRIQSEIDRLSGQPKIVKKECKSNIERDIKKILLLEQKELRKTEEQKKFPGLLKQIEIFKAKIFKAKIRKEAESIYSLACSSFAAQYLGNWISTFKNGCLKAEKLSQFLVESQQDIIFIHNFSQQHALDLSDGIHKLRLALTLINFPSIKINFIIFSLRFPDLTKEFWLESYFDNSTIKTFESTTIAKEERKKTVEKPTEEDPIFLTDGNSLSITKENLRLLMMINQSTNQVQDNQDKHKINKKAKEIFNILIQNIDFLFSKNNLGEVANLLLELLKMAYISLMHEIKDKSEIQPLTFSFILEIRDTLDRNHVLSLNTGLCMTFIRTFDNSKYRCKALLPKNKPSEKNKLPITFFYHINEADQSNFLMLSENFVNVLKICYEKALPLEIEKLNAKHGENNEEKRLTYMANLLRDEMSEHRDDMSEHRDMLQIGQHITKKYRGVAAMDGMATDLSSRFTGFQSIDLTGSLKMDEHLNSILAIGIEGIGSPFLKDYAENS